MSEEVFTEEEIAIVKEWSELTGVLGDWNETLYRMVDMGLAETRNGFPSPNIKAIHIRQSLYRDRKWTPDEYAAVVDFIDEPFGTPRQAELGQDLVRLGLGRFSPSGEAWVTGYGRIIEGKVRLWRM